MESCKGTRGTEWQCIKCWSMQIDKEIDPELLKKCKNYSRHEEIIMPEEE